MILVPKIVFHGYVRDQGWFIESTNREEGKLMQILIHSNLIEYLMRHSIYHITLGPVMKQVC